MTANLNFLGTLDPDSPRQVSHQIASALRAAILTGKLPPGARLPSQPQLASHYQVARETVKRALEVLRNERLVVTRQGSGAFVRERTGYRDDVAEIDTPRVNLTATDSEFLGRSIDLSKRALEDEGKTPFGAVVVVGTSVVGEGVSSVIELWDPTAHAEVMALREAGTALRRHLMPDATMYSSSEPCPMCLAACYWAQIPRLVCGASSYDVGRYGFEDRQFYRELTIQPHLRAVRVEAADGALHEQATDVLKSWACNLPEPVIPKL